MSVNISTYVHILEPKWKKWHKSTNKAIFKKKSFVFLNAVHNSIDNNNWYLHFLDIKK